MLAARKRGWESTPNGGFLRGRKRPVVDLRPAHERIDALEATLRSEVELSRRRSTLERRLNDVEERVNALDSTTGLVMPRLEYLVTPRCTRIEDGRPRVSTNGASPADRAPRGRP